MESTNENPRPPERALRGTSLTLTEQTAKLFGRSLFKVNALEYVAVGALVVTGVEYAFGAVVLLLVAYRRHLMRAVRLTRREPPPRLRFTKRVLAVMLVIGGLNVGGRAFATYALDSPGMTIALFNGITFGLTLLVFSVEEWRSHRVAAVVVPVAMVAGLAVAGRVWDVDASLGGVAWALACGLCGLLYLPVSRVVLKKSRAEGDQFQALNTLSGAVGLFLWAWIIDENFVDGWSWRLFGMLALTGLLSVIIPRYLHVQARGAIGDGFYAVLSTLSILIAVGVDYIMEGTVPDVWQIIGLSLVGAGGLTVGGLKWRDGRERGPGADGS